MIVEIKTGTAPQTIQVWKQERLVFHATALTADIELRTNLSMPNSVAVYKRTAANDAYIDVTDYLRAYASTITTFNFLVGMNTIIVSVSVAGLINPANVLIPIHSLKSYGALVIPPSMYYAGEQNIDVAAEFYAPSGTGSWNVSGNATRSTNGRIYGQITGDYSIVRNGSTIKSYKARPRQCDITYALVEWVSFSGIERTHWFEVVKHKQSTNDAFSLLPIDNEYIEIKGREDGFVLHLDNLDAYDLWYYADVLQSSKVKVSFDGNTYNRVQITNKSIVLPDGNAGTDGKLDINVNWKRYDSVAL